MANEETSGTNIFLTILGIIGLIAIIIGVATPEGWLRKWWNSMYPEKGQSKSDYDKCVASNKAKNDGDSCSNCIPAGSGLPIFNGIIKNGECVQRQNISVTYSATVSNISGAPVYTLQQLKGNPPTYTFNKTANSIAPNTNVGQILETSQAYIGNGSYVRTNSGWLLASDLNIVATRIQ